MGGTVAKKDAAIVQEAAQEAAQETPAGTGKGRPTPSRRERELARQRPLVPKDRKQAARDSRVAQQQEREKARLGMAAGDDRFLPARDKGPQRRWVRDYVDARLSVGEFLLPFMVVVLVLTFLPVPTLQLYAMLVVWVYLAISILDVVILGFVLRRKLAARFGAGNVQKGFAFYAAMRTLQLRQLRLPKPQVKRFKYPE